MRLGSSILAVLIGCAPALAIDLEGVQPAALDQPRVNVLVRRDAKGKPLTAVAGAGGGLADLLGGGGLGGAGDGDAANVQAFLDTGASGVLLSATTAKALGINHATAGGNKPVTFHDIGVAGSETFGVSEPLFLSIGVFGGPGEAGNDGYPTTLGPVRVQLAHAGGGLIEMLTGGLDVVGMPAMKGRVVVFDPRPVDTFGATMLARLLDPKRERKQIPRVDRTVMLSSASFARFTRTEPAGAQGPTLSDNPFVGPSPVGPARGAAVPPVVITLNGKRSEGSWLLDTGAAASMISTAQAKVLGITYAEGTEGTDAAKLDGVPADQQFTFTIGGIGGQKKAAGFFLDSLTLPTRERDPIVYKRAPVLVADITVTDPASNEQITLDGILGMNYFVASANIQQADLMPDINNLTVGAYEAIVFDEPAGTLGLKLKPEFNKPSPRGAGGPTDNGGRRGSIEIRPRSRGGP